MKTLMRAAGLSIALVTAAAGAHAQPIAPPQPAPTADPMFAATTLNLSAYGEARLPPDMATIALGVTNEAPTAAEALRANGVKMSAVVAALKKAGIEGRDLQTSNLSLNPQYVYEQNQPPRLNGYQASNQLTITVNDLARLGAVVDATVSAGATNVGQISFGLKNPLSAENTARVAAVKALQDKAALYASATGYHIRRLVTLSEGGGYVPPRPPMPMMAMRAEGVAQSAVVETGELKVRIDITGMFELTH
ncbi:MAG TPA: SIMPL domain-containing protein [Caulobacteraceae bacterium]|nr:SIMPL domain-containing protein [Caulobacteraceae bacterium]